MLYQNHCYDTVDFVSCTSSDQFGTQLGEHQYKLARLQALHSKHNENLSIINFFVNFDNILARPELYLAAAKTPRCPHAAHSIKNI